MPRNGALGYNVPIMRKDIRSVGAALALTLSVVSGLRAGETQVCLQAEPVRFGTSSGMRCWTPEKVPELKGNVRLTFEVREYEPAPGLKKSGHWGVTFENFRGEHGNVFCSGAGLHFVLGSALGKSLHGDDVRGRQPTVKIPCGEDGATNGWTRFTLESTPESLLAQLDGEICRSERATALPLKGLRFNAYNRDVEIRNVSLETFVPKPVRKVQKPVVSVPGPVSPGEIAVREEPVSSAVGGIMFWAKFRPGTDCVKFLDAAGGVKARFYCCGDFRIQADVAVRGAAAPLVYKRRLLDEATRARDDFHYAFTWREDGQVRFFLNGIPFDVGLGGDDYKKPLSGADLSGIVKVVVGDTGRAGREQEISDLHVYHRTLSNREVTDAYRARVPVDFVFQDSVLKADAPDALKLTVAPGGTYRLPPPVEGCPPVKGTVDVDAQMERIVTTRQPNGRERRSYEPVPASSSCRPSHSRAAATGCSSP